MGPGNMRGGGFQGGHGGYGGGGGFQGGHMGGGPGGGNDRQLYISNVGLNSLLETLGGTADLS